MRRACVFTLTEDVRATLERWSRSRSTEARLAERARIVLLAAEGRENKDIAAELEVTRATVATGSPTEASPGSRRTLPAAGVRRRPATTSPRRSSR